MSSTASNHSAHAEGYSATAKGDASHAEGNGTTAEGTNSHAEGQGSVAKGVASHAEGYYTIARGDYSHAQGKYNIEDVNWKYAHIVGGGESEDNRANIHTLDWHGGAWYAGDIKIGGNDADDPNAKILATKEDIETLKSEIYGEDVSEALDTIKELGDALENNPDIIDALRNTMVGTKTTEGGEIFNHYTGNVATGNYSHAEGDRTKATAKAAHTEGCLTEARGMGSHAEGDATIACGKYTHVQGKWNIIDNVPEGNNGFSKYVHIVGNGNSDTERGNAHTLDWQGNAWFAGGVKVGGKDWEDSDANSVVIAADLKPLLLDDQMAVTYETDSTYGDSALDAILKGRQILITTPSIGGFHTKSFSPVYMYQLPNRENGFLYLFYLTDEKDSLDLSTLGLGVFHLPKYAELKMKLSKEYNECPLQ